MRFLAAWLAFAGLVTLVPVTGAAQDIEQALKSLAREMEAIKEGQAKIQKDLDDIKAQLGPRSTPGAAAPPNTVLKLQKAPFKGASNARLVLLDFTDYQ